MFPYLFRLGPITVSSYGFMLAISFMLGVYLAKKRGATQGLSPEFVESFSMWLIVCGVIGSRFLFIFVEQGTRNWSQPWVFFKVWEGGLSFTGGFVLAIAYTIYRTRTSKISFWKLADVFSPSVCLGLCLAKIGCFLAGCCHGKVCDLPWAISFNHPETLAQPRGTPLHPSQLYESVMAIVVFGILMQLWKKRKFEGQIFLVFIILYGIGRVALEFTRGSEPLWSFGLSSPQVIMIVLVIMCIAFWPKLSKRGV